MAKCVKCGATLREGTNYCNQCGGEVEAKKHFDLAGDHYKYA